MSDALKERDRIIKEIISPAFKKVGFKKAANNFTKVEERFIKVFSIESSSWNTNEFVDFSLELGIVFPLIWEIQNITLPKNVSINYCHFNINSLALTKDSKQFIIQNNMNINEFENHVSEVINGFVIPFFNKFSNIEDCIDLYTSYTSYSFDVRPFVGLTLIEKGKIELGLELMNGVDLLYTEEFKDKLLNHKNYLISR